MKKIYLLAACLALVGCAPNETWNSTTYGLEANGQRGFFVTSMNSQVPVTNWIPCTEATTPQAKFVCGKPNP